MVSRIGTLSTFASRKRRVGEVFATGLKVFRVRRCDPGPDRLPEIARIRTHRWWIVSDIVAICATVGLAKRFAAMLRAPRKAVPRG